VTEYNDIRVEGEVVEVSMVEPKEGGEWPSLAIRFAYMFGEPETKRHITTFKFLTPAAIEYTEKDLITLGWDPTKNNWGLDDLIDTKAIVGVRVNLVLGYEEYQGKSHLKVKFINALGGALKGKIEGPAVTDWTKKLRARLGVSAPATRKAAPKASAPVTQPAEDLGGEIIPF